jgi:hypothetical protein
MVGSERQLCAIYGHWWSPQRTPASSPFQTFRSTRADGSNVPTGDIALFTASREWSWSIYFRLQVERRPSNSSEAMAKSPGKHSGDEPDNARNNTNFDIQVMLSLGGSSALDRKSLVFHGCGRTGSPADDLGPAGRQGKGHRPR